MNKLKIWSFVIFISFLEFNSKAFGSLKFAVSSGNFSLIQHKDASFNKVLHNTYHWILPQVSKTPLKTRALQEVILLLISNHNFPNLQEINDFILKTDQFLEIEDKYLLINYITNFTPFAQIYVNKYQISSQEFNKIIENAKQNNALPKHFVEYIKQEYSTYKLLNKAINENFHAKIVKQIANVRSKEEQSLLYTRLYLKGYGKYKQHYQYTRENSLDDELSIHDKISYYAKHKNYRDISKYIEKLPATLQYGDLWWENNQVIILEMIQNGFSQSAYSLLQKIYLTRSHEKFARKEMLAGTLALFLEKPDKAFEHFHNVYLTTNYVDEQVQSAYFIAQSYKNLENFEAHKYWLSIASQHPSTFYGIMAFEELNDVANENVLGSKYYMQKTWLDRTKERKKAIQKRLNIYYLANFYKNTKTFEDLPSHIQEMLEIARVLNDEQYTNYAKDFIISAGKQIKDPSLFPVFLEYVCGRFNQYTCVDAKNIAMHNGYINKEMFPRIGSDAINEDIKKYHLPLLHAIIKKESNFKEIVKSKVGARGLMQVMPATAKFICHAHNIEFNQRKLNYDPDYNIKLGTLYINDLLKRYDGSYVLALMAYNAGYGSVGKWEGVYSRPQTPAQMVTFIELIPFKETRNYVKRIVEYEAIYEYFISQD